MKKLSTFLALSMLFLLSGCGTSGSESSAPVSGAGSVNAVASSSVTSGSESSRESSRISTPVLASEAISTSQLPASQISSSQSTPHTESRSLAENVEERYRTGLGDLSGVVLEADAEGFSVEGGVPRTSADGQYAVLGTELEAEVAYTDKTVFLYAEYERATDKSACYRGSVDDVAQGRSVAVWGAYEGDAFVAAAVRVVVFV